MRTSVLTLLLLLPSVATADVSDKMPTISQILVWGVVVSVVLLSLCRFRWWLVGLGLPIALWLIVETIALWLEVPMREALLQEQGPEYFASIAIVDLLIVVSVCGGAFAGWRQRDAAQQNLATDAPKAARR